MQEIQEIHVQSLGQEDPLEGGCILAWRIPWTEEPGGLYSSWGPKEADTAEATEHAAFMLGRKGKGFNSPDYISFTLRTVSCKCSQTTITTWSWPSFDNFFWFYATLTLTQPESWLPNQPSEWIDRILLALLTFKSHSPICISPARRRYQPGLATGYFGARIPCLLCSATQNVIKEPLYLSGKERKDFRVEYNGEAMGKFQESCEILSSPQVLPCLTNLSD